MILVSLIPVCAWLQQLILKVFSLIPNLYWWVICTGFAAAFFLLLEFELTGYVLCWMVISLARFLSSFGRSWVYSIPFMKWKMPSRIFSDFHFYFISALSWHCPVCKSCPFEDQEQLMYGGFGTGCRYLSAQQLVCDTSLFLGWAGETSIAIYWESLIKCSVQLQCRMWCFIAATWPSEYSILLGFLHCTPHYLL